MILHVGSWGHLCQNSKINLSLSQMLPDYPHKRFYDKRGNYILLLLTLAIDA